MGRYRGHASTGPVTWLIVALVVVAIVDVALSAWQQYLLQRTAHGIVFGVRRQLVGRMLRLPMTEYDRRTSGDLVSRVVDTDTEAVHGAVTGGMVEVVGSVLVGIGAAVAIFVIDPLLAVLTVLTFGIGVGGSVIAVRGVQVLQHALYRSMAKAQRPA